MLTMMVLGASGTVVAQASAADYRVDGPVAHTAGASTARFAPGGGGVLRVGPGGRSPVGRASVRLTCRAPDGLACAIGVAIGYRGHIVAKGRIVLRGSTTLRLRLSGYAQAQLQHHGIRLKTVAVAYDHHHHRAVAGFSGTLRRVRR
ncbi:MAG: hypothetical protein ACR2IP_05090 [Solirubrobacteraceae bacterium]